MPKKHKSGFAADRSGTYHFTGGDAEKEEQLKSLLHVLADRPDLKQVALSRTLSPNQKAKLLNPYLEKRSAELTARKAVAAEKLEQAKLLQIEAAVEERNALLQIIDFELDNKAFTREDGPIAALLVERPDMLATLHDWAIPISDRREQVRQYLHAHVYETDFTRKGSSDFEILLNSVFGDKEYTNAQPALISAKTKLEQSEKILDELYANDEIRRGNIQIVEDLAHSLFSSGNTKSLYDLLQGRPDLQLLMMDESKPKQERADKIIDYLREIAETRDLKDFSDPFVQRMYAAMHAEINGDTTIEGPAGISDDPAALEALKHSQEKGTWGGKTNPVAPEEVSESYKQELIESVRLIAAWAAIEKPVLQPNDCSRLHKLIEANDAGKVIAMPDITKDGQGRLTTRRFSGALNDCKVFVVKHDWASLLGDSASDDVRDDDLQLPADSSSFEFRISDKNVIVIATNITGTTTFCPIVEALNGVWFTYVCETKLPAFEFAIEQARACCVMLDAQVATHEVTRAPPALNVKRAKQGKPPLRDFYTIDLSRRKRAAPPPGGYAESGKHKRLHFCRSHWRHFNTESMHPGRPSLQAMCPEPKCRAGVNEACRQVRIPWCLKGDPDLGFVNKHYRL